MKKASLVVGFITLLVVAIVIAPTIIAFAAAALFSTPFWPVFWLSFGVGLLLKPTTISSKGA